MWCDFGRKIGPACHGDLLSQFPPVFRQLDGDTRNCVLFTMCTRESAICQETVDMGDSSIDCDLPIDHLPSRHYDKIYKLVWESFDRD